MHIAIIANGQITNYPATKQKLKSANHIIACDGGLRHAQAMDIWPDIIIGDLDSAPAAYLSTCKQKGIPINTHPTQKDDTDLALAMEYALTLPAASITIIGALGGRPDHLLANIHVLQIASCANGVNAEIWDDTTSIQLIHNSLHLQKEDYQTISLIPLSTEATGITTQGLAYPLKGETLHLGTSRGVSNCFNANKATVTVESGVLIAIRCK